MKRLSLAILLSLALPSAALADTTTVDPAASGCTRGGSCSTIAAAITAASAGDTLVIKPAQYAESITVGKALTINAQPGAILAGRASVTVADVKIDGLGILVQSGTGAALTSSAGKLSLTNSAVVSFSSPAVAITGGADNHIQRSTIASSEGTAATSDGIAMGPGSLTVDSSIVLGGAKGAGFRVTTTSGGGAASLTLNHTTTVAPLTGHAVVLDGSGGSLPVMPVGGITLKVASSIVHGPNAVSSDAGIPILRAANAVTASFASSDATEFKGADGSTVAGTGNPTPDNLLFLNSKLRLKPTAPVIDKGGAVAAGESGTDIDGDPRTNGAATDIGADEFTNHAPTLDFAVTPSSPSTADKVTVTATATDKEGPQDIAGYITVWGDGTKRDQTSSNVIQHVYEKPGTYTITMGASDRSGAASNVVTKEITVTDGTPPQFQITTPADGGSVKHPKRGKLQLNVKGVFADPSGVQEIDVALTRKGSGCLQYTGSKLTKRSCTKFTFVKAKLSGNGFRLVTKKGLDIIRGSYELRAKGVDTKGNTSSTFDKATKSLISFKVK